VCTLYALHTVNDDLAWFLAHGRLAPGRGKAVNGAVNALCAELRPHARLLVDAFAIPERFLDAAILREEPDRQDVQWRHDQANAAS
jgi:acyl-CoA oxidase